MSRRIQFAATISKVTTLSDMGLRVALDLPEDAVLAAAELMAMRQAGAELIVSIEVQEHEQESGTP